MKQVDVLSPAGEKLRTVALHECLVNAKPNDHVEYLYIKAYLANQRQGTHGSKPRSDVAGSTRKLHKQKGTGGSRKGDIKNPLFRGGGRVFGPLPRNYYCSLNKKTKRLARISALSRKLETNNLFVVEGFDFKDCKTKGVVVLLRSLGFSSTDRVLLVASKLDENLLLAARNLPNVCTVTSDSLNAYDIAKFASVVFEESALNDFQSTLGMPKQTD